MVTHVDQISTPPTPADPPSVFEERAARVWSDLARAVPQMNQQADEIEAIGQAAGDASRAAQEDSDAALRYRNEANYANSLAQSAAASAGAAKDGADDAKRAAEEAADRALTAAEDAENRVPMTSATGGALLPEGNDAQRPASGAIPAGALLLRGSTQDQNDYKLEFWDRIAAEWKAFADRYWVGKQIAAAVQSVKDWVDQQIGFAIIYPNNGTSANPASVAINSRYINANPFPGRSVICQAQVLVNGKWGATGWVLNSSNSLSNGVNADQYGDDIVVQTGSTQLTTSSIYDGSPFGSITPATSLQCRVLVWKLKG